MSDVSRVDIPSGELVLEGRLQTTGRKQEPAVVVCHPHPQFGGSMDNNVVYALEDHLLRRGISTLAFNVRGTGSSQGQWDNMRGEVLDVIAALQFLAKRPEVDAARVGLAGYSFGGLMSLYACSSLIGNIRASSDSFDGADRFQPSALALISPMLTMKGWAADQGLKEYFSSPMLTLVIAGTADQFCPLSSMKDLAVQVGPEAALVIVEGADHFYGGNEIDAGSHTADFMARTLSV